MVQGLSVMQLFKNDAIAQMELLHPQGIKVNAIVMQSDLALAERLIAANHQSPQEHQAWGARLPLMVQKESNERFFGNIRGWVQYRKYLENQHAIG